VAEAQRILAALGLPAAQRNERSALCLLALLDLTPRKAWSKAAAPLRGITPLMAWVRDHYGRNYAPNTRETFRRQTIHQFCDAGMVLYNPDQPDRPVNSPHAVYQVEPATLALIQAFGSSVWQKTLADYLAQRQTLVARYAKIRRRHGIPVTTAKGMRLRLSPGAHSDLIRAVIEEFVPRFAPGSALVYAGDTGVKWGYFDKRLLTQVGVEVGEHGKMPDVVLYYPDRDWLLLVEAVISHGPVDDKRHGELARLFDHSTAGLVYVSAFPDRKTMGRYLSTIAWETEVWTADAPSHLIHFNGDRFWGPYDSA
jgi:hypothetical protein